jgi:hypothetical protein
MKRAIRVFALTIVSALFAGNASAVDLATTATVNIVEGITISETQGLNFGTLVLNNGDVVIAADGTVTDASLLTQDGTSQSQATFDVTSISGVDLDVTLTPGPAASGLTLSAMSWAVGAVSTSPFTSGGTDVLNVGGTLTVDRSAASVGAGQTVDYTVSVTFN